MGTDHLNGDARQEEVDDHHLLPLRRHVLRAAQRIELERFITGDDDSATAAAVGGSLYLDMLTDLPRNRAYRRALEGAITPGKVCQCLDIGTGTGLLALMAARAGAAPASREGGLSDEQRHVGSCRHVLAGCRPRVPPAT